MATLVGTIDDITKQVRSPRAPVARPRRGLGVRPPPFAAIAGILLGVLLGVFGWTIWSRDSTDTIGSAPEPVAEQQPSATKSPSPPVITLAAATPVPAEEEPAPARFAYVGTLSIDAAPGGQVFINRQARGQTPLRVQNLKAGSHLVWIEREGYRRFTRVVEVPADRVSRVFADLEPIPER